MNFSEETELKNQIKFEKDFEKLSGGSSSFVMPEVQIIRETLNGKSKTDSDNIIENSTGFKKVDLQNIEEMFNGGVRPKNFKAAMFNFFNNNLTESKLISCFNIPYIGETSLVEHNIRTLQQLRDYIDELENKVVLESVFDSTLFKWWKHNKIGREDMICCVELLKQFFKTEEEITSDTHLYCISGPVPDFYGNKNTYATAISDINSNYKYVKDVTSSIEYLVTTETNTSKVIKAHKYGVKIVDFDEFMKICKK